MFGNKRTVLCTVLAVMAPITHFGGTGYMGALLTAVGVIPLVLLAGDGLKRISRVEAVVELIWLGLVLGSLLPLAGENWTGEKTNIAVPLALLLLTTLEGGKERGERACTVLFWIVLIPMILIGGILSQKIEPKWMSPKVRIWKNGMIVALLMPALNETNLPGRIKSTMITAGIAIAGAALVQGGLGKGIETEIESPLYELGRCVGTGGFEILISVVLTISWFGFASYVMRVSEAMGMKLGMERKQTRMGIVILSSLMIVLGVRLEEWIMTAGCMILWILIPILHSKKLKKDEKRC